MANRGRPKKDGVKPGWMLFRSFMVLHAYDQARARGEKHSAAIAEAVSALRSRMPGMPISETEVRRVLQNFDRRTLNGIWCVTKASRKDRSLTFCLIIFNGLPTLLRNSPKCWMHQASPATISTRHE